MFHKKNRINTKAYNQGLNLLSLVREELKICESNYTKQSVYVFKRYYNNLITDEDFYNYIKHYYSLRLNPLLENISTGIKMWDVGCGTGSEAIYCGIKGASVTAMDISKNRINLASERLNYYERKFNKSLNVKFSLKNIFSHSEKYDIIWAKEAISHIFPIEEFIKISYKNLNKGGRLIISDENKLNPYIYSQSKKIQKREGGKIISKKDPITGENIKYAMERYFSIPNLKKKLSKYFFISEISPINFIPFFIFTRIENFSKILEELFLRKIPVFNLLAGFYVITSIKS